MEEQQSLFELNVDESTAVELIETSRWSKLLAILVLSMVGLVVGTLLFAWNRIQEAFAQEVPGGDWQTVMAFVVVILGIVIVVGGLMMFFLVRAGNRIRLGLRTNDQQVFNNGLNDLKTYFVFLGVIGILSLLSNLFSSF